MIFTTLMLQLLALAYNRSMANRNSDKVLTSRSFMCTKLGKRPADAQDVNTKRPRAETKTGSNARMGIILNRKSNKYVV